jgi:PiT family inorganic phosphate transporter
LSEYKHTIGKVQEIYLKVNPSSLSKADSFEFAKINSLVTDLNNKIGTYNSFADFSGSDQIAMRKDIIIIGKATKKLLESQDFYMSENDKKILNVHVGEMKSLTEYAPMWVIVMIAISLGLGTMVGWKRIVKTIGEKIGKQHLTYAQGASSELVAAITIGLSTAFKLPVSTTHILSSGIAGSMVASKGVNNLKTKTIKTILSAWILTLPVTIGVSCGLFLLFRYISG